MRHAAVTTDPLNGGIKMYLCVFVRACVRVLHQLYE
jgi:hypothetical protein